MVAALTLMHTAWNGRSRYALLRTSNSVNQWLLNMPVSPTSPTHHHSSFEVERSGSPTPAVTSEASSSQVSAPQPSQPTAGQEGNHGIQQSRKRSAISLELVEEFVAKRKKTEEADPPSFGCWHKPIVTTSRMTRCPMGT